MKFNRPCNGNQSAGSISTINHANKTEEIMIYRLVVGLMLASVAAQHQTTIDATGDFRPFSHSITEGHSGSVGRRLALQLEVLASNLEFKPGGCLLRRFRSHQQEKLQD